MRGVIAALIVLFCALGSASATAQEVRFGDENIGVELVADGPPVPGKDWTLAFHFTPVSTEWHGYWSNPGDAGLGMALQWQLPEGWEVGEALYRVPERLLIADLMNHIYEGEYTVLIPVRVPEDAAVANVVPITVFAEYLACTDAICVPQDAFLTVDPSKARGDLRFGRWRAAIAPLLDTTGRFALTDDTLRVAIPVPAALDVGQPHVFVENTDLVSYTAAQTFARDGDTLIAEIPLGSAVAPDELRGIISFDEDAGEGVRFIARPGEVPVGGKPLARSMQQLPSLWLALLGALLGGLLLNIMPCVFPILSLKALSLAKAGGDENEARRDALAYTAGVVLACVALGALMLALRAAGQQIGWAFQLQEPGVVVALLVLVVTITANFGGVFELPALASGRSSGTSSFGTGLLAAFVATPCTGPFMAAAMGAALLLPTPIALGLFAALGLGLALPFLVLGFLPALRSKLPAPGPWMERFRRIMAIPMGLTALALIWLVARIGGQGFAMTALVLVFGVVVALIVVGKLQRRGRMAWPAFALIAAPFAVFAAFALPASYSEVSTQDAASIHDPIAFSDTALAEARASGAPVFVWFTADWCVTCKVNEGVAIEQQKVREAFEAAGVVTMRGDWTRRDEAITRFLTKRGAAGVPLYLWYPAGGAEPQQLPQVLTPGLLVELADSYR